MYDNTIKLLKLDSIKNQIESIETISYNQQLTVKLKMKQISFDCPLCQTPNMYSHGFRSKKIIHSISIDNKIMIEYNSRRYRCRNCQKVISESNPFNQKYERISLKTKVSILEYL